MNKKQLISLWIGIIFFVFFAFATKTSSGNLRSGQIWTDYGPLFARLLSTVVVTSGLIYTFKDKQKK